MHFAGAFMSIFLTVSAVFAGGVDTGGGTGIRLDNGDLELLDIANFAKDKFQLRKKDFVVSRSEFFDQSGSMKINLKDLPHFSIMLQLMNGWNAGPQDVIHHRILKAMLDLQITFIKAPLAPELVDAKSYFGNYKYAEKVPVALYVKKFGLVISLSPFEELTVDQQIVLLFHETLRKLKIDGGYDIDEVTLQVTSVALASGPSHQFYRLNQIHGLWPLYGDSP